MENNMAQFESNIVQILRPHWKDIKVLACQVALAILLVLQSLQTVEIQGLRLSCLHWNVINRCVFHWIVNNRNDAIFTLALTFCDMQIRLELLSWLMHSQFVRYCTGWGITQSLLTVDEFKLQVLVLIVC